MRPEAIKKHATCNFSIRWKMFKGRTSPTPGLFCICHNTLLDWLPDQVAHELIDVDHLPVEPYIEKKKNKKPKHLTHEQRLAQVKANLAKI